MRHTLAIMIVVLAFFCLVGQLYGETIYFLVAETNTPPVYGDSYVLPLTEPNDIAHARDLIAHGPSIGQPIVVATVACGSDCINRDYLNPDKPAWYWHVADFNSFTDSVPPPDGYTRPLSVNWDCQSDGFIACPLYTVVYELGADPKHWRRDFDDDDDVDFLDYAPVSGNWDNNCVGPGWCGGTDLDHSGKVDYNDLGLFTDAWLSPYADVPTPGSSIEFPCWAWRYQCYGDADNEKTVAGYRVYTNDEDIFNDCLGKPCGWPCEYPNEGYNPCADFNRDYKVYDDDLAILQANWQKKDSALEPPCPPELICQP